MSSLRKPFLWATVSSVALGGTPGLAADMAVKAPPSPVAAPAYDWTGFYTGLNLGGATHHATTNDLNNYSGIPPANYVTPWFESNKSVVTVGGQAGYNLQLNHVVVGVEADINYIGAKTTFAPTLNAGVVAANCPTCVSSATNELDWLATFRGRIGIPIQQFLIYGTGGLAVGQISNSWGFGFPGLGGNFSPNQFSVSETRAGAVYGGGIEYAAWGHWIARVEALYVNLGTTNAINPTANILVGGTPPFTTAFKNTATIGRAALSYKW
jgi:outer membrane immunogenic protein